MQLRYVIMENRIEKSKVMRFGDALCEGEIVQSGQGFGQTLVVAGQASEPGGQAEAALDHLAPG